MAKKSKASRGKGDSGLMKAGSIDQIVRMDFRHVITVAAVDNAFTTFAELELKLANLGDRVSDLGVNWERYRLTDLRVEAVSGAYGLTKEMVAMAWSPDPAAEVGTPASLADLCGFPVFRLAPGPVGAQMHLTRKLLCRDAIPKWFSTGIGTGNDQLDTQGTLFYRFTTDASTTAYNGYIVLRGRIEFCEPVDPQLVGAAALERFLIKNRLHVVQDQDEDEKSLEVVQRKPPPSGGDDNLMSARRVSPLKLAGLLKH